MYVIFVKDRNVIVYGDECKQSLNNAELIMRSVWVVLSYQMWIVYK